MYLEPSHTTMLKLFAKILNVFFWKKNSIADARLGSKYASAYIVWIKFPNISIVDFEQVR